MKAKTLSFLLLVSILLIIIWRFNIFSIDNIKVSNLAECVSQDQLNQEINSLDKNWVLLNQKKFEAKLISKFSCIKNVNVTYEFPKTVRVDIYGRKFLAKIISIAPLDLTIPESTLSSQSSLIDWSFPPESSEDALVIDETGYIFAKTKSDFTIPTIFISEDINFGTKLDQQSFESIDQIFSKIITLAPISYQPNFKAKKYGVTLLINTEPKLAFLLKKDILKQLASLQLILQKAKIDERVAEFIDLRFDKPVVQFRSKSSK